MRSLGWVSGLKRQEPRKEHRLNSGSTKFNMSRVEKDNTGGDRGPQRRGLHLTASKLQHLIRQLALRSGVFSFFLSSNLPECPVSSDVRDGCSGVFRVCFLNDQIRAVGVFFLSFFF